MVQLRAYESELQKRGHEATYISDPTPKLAGYTHRPPYDEAWLFNVNFKWTITQARAAQEAGVPYKVFAIFYPGLSAAKNEWAATHEEVVGVIEGAMRIYMLSEAETDELVTEYPQARGKVEIIDNGVDRGLFNETDAKPVAERIGVVAVGRYETAKGQLLLLEACADLGIPCATIGQVVDPIYYGSCTSVARTSGNKAGGPMSREDLAKVLKQTRLFVLASNSERNSLTILEAAAAGCEVLDSVHNRAHTLRAWNAADPQKFDSFKMAIARAYKKPRNRAKEVKSWGQVVNDIINT